MVFPVIKRAKPWAETLEGRNSYRSGCETVTLDCLEVKTTNDIAEKHEQDFQDLSAKHTIEFEQLADKRWVSEESLKEWAREQVEKLKNHDRVGLPCELCRIEHELSRLVGDKKK